MYRIQKIFFHFFIIIFYSLLALNAQQLAFPGAEGFGAYTTGGRGGTVYHVTNLDDSGPGSLRDAVSQPNRTVVFDVGGVINIGARIVVRNNITIVGQTAPGGGITIYGNGMAFNDGSGNNIVRYIRIRMGKNGELDKDAVSVSGGHNYIFDHVSISWGRDGTLDVNDNGAGKIDSLTFQDCIIAQGINIDNHSTGGLMQSGTWSVIRSLYIDNKTRNPKARGRHEFINSVLYNWSSNGYIMGDTEGLSESNLIGNYFIYGPSSSGNSHITRTTPSFHVYAEDNWIDSNKDGVLNASLFTDYKTATVEATSFFSFGINNQLPAQDALNHVIQYAGASLYRDAVDTLLINQLTSYGTRGKIINIEDDNGIAGNVGTVPGGIAPTDTDQDGMPDDWEDANELDKNDPDDRNNDYNDDGFTNLEDYLNSLIPVESQIPPDSSPPSAPGNLSAVTFSGNQVDLSWSDNAHNERGFLVQYSDDDWDTYQEVASLWANMSSYSVTGLSGSTRYQFRVAAYNDAGNSEYSNIASDSTIADNHFFLYTTVDGPGGIELDPPGEIYAAGTQVQVSAIADSGYIFDSWAGYLSGTDNPETVTVTTTVTVTAKFAIKSTNVPLDYDFGPGSLEQDFTQVTTADATYSAARGYGFLSTSGLEERDRSAPDALREDFIFSESAQSFLVDLPNGEYNVTVIAGDNLADAPNGPMDVFAEGQIKIQAMQSEGGEFSEETFNIVIADSQLSLILRHSTGSGPWRINALKIASGLTEIEDLKPLIPADYALEQNFPNPFNPSTMINYQLSVNSEVELALFDLTGKQVNILVKRYQSKGSYQVAFDGSNLPSGVYFYRLTTSHGFSQTRKMILIK